jgi:hypothetical protein
LNPTAIFSKTGKGVQEASGKTSNLSRADRAVLKEIDGKTALQNIAAKFDKIAADKFDALIAQFDKDGYIREVSSGATAPQAPLARSAPPAAKAPPPPPAGGDDDEMDFTQAIKLPPKAPPAPPKAPPVDLAAAASRAEAERKAKEQQAFDYKSRQEAELKAKAEAEQKARAAAEAKARAESEARAKAEAEAKARAEAEAKTRAEADAKVKAAREAAVRMATEVKAKAEAEAKAKADAAAEREREALEKARKESEDKARMQAELTGKLEEERKAREEAERRASEAAERARKELEEKAKRDADELRQRLEAEMKAKLEEERKAREAEDRKRREEDDRRRAEEDRKRREEDERRRKEEEERRAKEEAERRARQEEDRKQREEDDRRRKEEEARRAKEDADRKARDEEDRKRREEEDRKRAEAEKQRKEADERRAKEDAERRAKEDAERRAKEEAERRAKDEADRRAREESERRAKEEAEAKARAAQSASSASIPTVAPPAPPAAGGGLSDSLLADLDSFGAREEEEQKAKEEAERKAKEEAARKAKVEADRRAKEEAELRAKEEAERKRREQEEQRAKEEAEQRAREEEEQKAREEAERKRKAKEAQAAKEAERKAPVRATPARGSGKDDDIEVSDDDLDMDEIKKDQKALSATARKAAREREAVIASATPGPRPKKWGKPAAIALFVLLAVGIGALQLMPVSTAEYEKAASDAMGVPVKIGSARLSVITGIEARFENVSVGEAVKIRAVRGYPEVGSLFGAKKSFSRIELDGVSIAQSQLGDAVLGKVSGENFRVGRILVKQVKFDGPLALPALDVEATVAADGSLDSVNLRGGDSLKVHLSPRGENISFEISAANLALPFAPKLNLSEFGMKGSANRTGVTASDFDGRAFDGVISGSAKIRWGASWTVDGEIRARGVKIAVLAPALVSEGKADGRGAYTMSGTNPGTLFEGARIQGEFKIDKGVLGSFDLTRALQTGGAQTTGRTIFSELTGQAVYDKGTVRISNAAITAGAMNAGATLDVDANGGLSGRIVADVKTPNQTLRATLNVSGKIQDPVIRK